MKIYLSGSISGGRQKIQTYIRMKEIMESCGHVLTSPQTADPTISDAGEKGDLSPRQIFERDVRQIIESDLMIAEITVPSHGVGYEIAFAIHNNKPILCLYDLDNAPKRISAMIAGNSSQLVTVKGYHESTLDSLLKHELESYERYYFDDV